MSNNTINTALRRLGYSSNEQTGHGFRSMASTLLNEQGFPPDVIELQLAHSERNKVRAAYNKAQGLPERRKMMQAWADYRDALRERARFARDLRGVWPWPVSMAGGLSRAVPGLFCACSGCRCS